MAERVPPFQLKAGQLKVGQLKVGQLKVGQLKVGQPGRQDRLQNAANQPDEACIGPDVQALSRAALALPAGWLPGAGAAVKIIQLVKRRSGLGGSANLQFSMCSRGGEPIMDRIRYFWGYEMIAHPAGLSERRQMKPKRGLYCGRHESRWTHAGARMGFGSVLCLIHSINGAGRSLSCLPWAIV